MYHMIDKKQDICKNELYEVCSELQYELRAYESCISNLSELVGECFMPAPIADPEASDYIERCFQFLLGYSHCTKDLLEMLNEYINQFMKAAGNVDEKACVEHSKCLMNSISEKFPTETDIINLKDMIFDCKKIIDNLCNQKWQGGENSCRIDAVFSLVEYHKQFSKPIEQMKYFLSRYIDELSEIKNQETFMAAVYASPEIMMGTSPMFSPIEKDQTYPYMHSFSGTFSDILDTSMACVYASPEMMQSKKRKKGILNKLFKRND